MNVEHLNWLGTALFALAVAHTFSVRLFQEWAQKYPEGSVGENLFHMLGEVEVIFGIWGGIFFFLQAAFFNYSGAVHYIESQNFTEPMFVFVIMAMASTRPVLNVANTVIRSVARFVPLPASQAFLVTSLIVGPLMGSFITEPAAMTVVALLLKSALFEKPISDRMRHAILAVLFVNISIGGVLTHFAAPPVVMVSSVWNWDTPFMFAHFGWKALIAVFVNAIALSFFFRNELKRVDVSEDSSTATRIPAWLTVLHFWFIAAVVVTAHHPAIFMGLFLFFLGVATITREYQDDLKLKESLLVGFFLGGLVVLGGVQRWWLEPLLASMGEAALFFGAAALTAVTDNAALTYLGSQVPNLPDALKYALVAGAVTGGGLTVIANAPNPAGFSILQSSFGPSGVNPVRLLFFALAPTVIAALCLWFLPS